MAYAPQTPWMVNATIRDNILFGEEYEVVRYRRVIQVRPNTIILCVCVCVCVNECVGMCVLYVCLYHKCLYTSV